MKNKSIPYLLALIGLAIIGGIIVQNTEIKTNKALNSEQDILITNLKNEKNLLKSQTKTLRSDMDMVLIELFYVEEDTTKVVSYEQLYENQIENK